MTVIQWYEAQSVFRTPDGSSATPEPKPFASQGVSTTGSVIGEPGRSIRAEVILPADIVNARLVFRYARQHWSTEMEPAQIDCVIASGGKQHTACLTFPDTGGWGRGSCAEWSLAGCAAGDLQAGKADITLTSWSKFSDVALDGFFIVPERFGLFPEEFFSLGRVSITSEGYIGIGLPNDTVNQHESKGFPVVGRGFTDREERVTVALHDENEEQEVLFHKDARMALSDQVTYLHIGPEQIRTLPDGNYTLQVTWADGARELTMPFTVVGDLMCAARKQHGIIKDFITQQQPTTEPSALDDFRYLEEYAREVLNVLDHRTGTQLAPEVFNRTKEYFWHRDQFTTNPAHRFADDLYHMISQSGKMMENVRIGAPACRGVRGLVRRAFVSQRTGQLQEYQLYLPKAYTDTGAFPLLIRWCGSENMFRDPESGIAPDVLEARGCVMVSPKVHGFDKLGMNGDVAQMVARILDDYPGINPRRVFCYGLSAGGYGSYMLATRYPDLVAGIGCIMGSVRMPAENKYKEFNIANNAFIPVLKGKRIFIGHGTRDRIVPKEHTDFFARELDRLGIGYRYDVYDVEHDIRPGQYVNEMLDWFGIGER